jgi:uncharacterized membrane protein YbhN (UPF0104 family)
LAVVLWHVGAGPFLAGIGTVDGTALTAAAGLGALTTLGCAWRWKIVAAGLRVDLRLPAAVAAYYRSLFLNVTLPGGIVGDVHRGVSHGREAGDVGGALRAVAWERIAGQVVQVVLTVAVLLALPSPASHYVPALAIALVLAALLVVLVARARPSRGRSGSALLRRVVAGDIGGRLLTGRAWLGIGLLSALVVCGHAATFLIAARAAGATASPSEMLPLALLVMVAMALPSIGGWGPREGAAAWAFGAAGLGAEQGITTAVAYGVMVLVACLPGAAVLVVSWSRRHLPAGRAEPPLAGGPARG